MIIKQMTKCNLYVFQLEQWKLQAGIGHKNLFEWIVDFLNTTFTRDYEKDEALALYFETELVARYEGKHLNLPADALKNLIKIIFIDNLWMMDLLQEVFREQVKLQDNIYKNYRGEYGNDSPIISNYGGIDTLDDDDKEMFNSSDKTESYSYTKLSKMIQTNNLQKKQTFNTVWIELNKIFWNIVCNKEHVLGVPYVQY